MTTTGPLTKSQERRVRAIIARLAALSGDIDRHRDAMAAAGKERSALARELTRLVGAGEAARLTGLAPASLWRLRGGYHGSSARIARNRA